MAFKMKGFSGFPQKPTKKRIVSATDFETSDGELVGTEYLERDEDLEAGYGKVKGGSSIVYRKGGKKYVKDEDTGEFIQIPRSEIRRLKKKDLILQRKKLKNKTNKLWHLK